MIFSVLLLAAAGAASTPVQPAPHKPTYAHHAVSTADPASQALFDRGLTLFYAYNGSEGLHAFQALEEREPKLAIAYWGEALSYGPDINTPLTEAGFFSAHTAIEKAVTLESTASDDERAYIDAMRLRFSGPWEDHAKADRAYRDAMAAAVAKFPTDDDLGTLYVEALLEYHGPRGLFKTGTDTPTSNDTTAMTSELDAIIARNPAHLMANHLNIHIFEDSSDRTRAIASARRLDAMPFASEDEHLTHMTAHTWVDVGDYAKAVRASKRAIAMFDAYLATPGIDPTHKDYIWHDISIGFMASMMLSNYDDATWFAKRLAAYPRARAPVEFAAMRFERWSDITATPKNDADPIHFALAYEKIQHGDTAGAATELKDALDAKTPVSYLLYALRGATAAMQNDLGGADKNFRKALALEHDSYFGENIPYLPTAELMGATYFRLGDYAKAEAAYRDALQSYPNDPHAVRGLAQTLQKLGKPAANGG